MAPQQFVDETTANMSNEELIQRDGYAFDLAIVLPTEQPGAIPDEANKIIRLIKAAKMETRVYLSCQNDEVYCEIRASLPRLMQFADQVDKTLLLDRDALQALAEKGDASRGIKPMKINGDSAISKLSPYESIYGKYDRREDIQNLYGETPFRTGVRLRLIQDILECPRNKGGAGLKLDKMRKEKKILGYYPLHRADVRDKLMARWLDWKLMPNAQPFDAIKDYLGEKVGLYFTFLGHYCHWTLPLALLGLITQIVVWGTHNPEHPLTLAFAALVILWAILMLEFWKRKEKQVALRWGMLGFEEVELDRPEFVGEEMASPIDGSLVTYYPPDQAAKRRRVTGATIMSFIVVVIACIAGIYGLKWFLVFDMKASWGETYGNIIASLCNSVQIQILNMVYQVIAIKLNNFENHKTDTQYEDSLVIKLFSFQFCNSYGSFIYLAFIGQPLIGVACEMNCLKLLGQNLGIVFGTNIIMGNMTEVLLPYYNYKQKVKKESSGANLSDAEMTTAEKEYMLTAYDPILGVLMDYAELAIQFGYLTLFVVAFPLTPFLAAVSNWIEIRSDAFKLLTQFQRPVPRGAEDIGKWHDIFVFLAGLCVVTNCALVCFIYQDIVGSYQLSTQCFVFIVIQYIFFFFMFGLSAAVPDVPLEVDLQMKRQKFITSRLIDMVADEDDDDDIVVAEDEVSKIDVFVSPRTSPKNSPQKPPQEAQQSDMV